MFSHQVCLSVFFTPWSLVISFPFPWNAIRCLCKPVESTRKKELMWMWASCSRRGLGKGSPKRREYSIASRVIFSDRLPSNERCQVGMNVSGQFVRERPSRGFGSSLRVCYLKRRLRCILRNHALFLCLCRTFRRTISLSSGSTLTVQTHSI